MYIHLLRWKQGPINSATGGLVRRVGPVFIGAYLARAMNDPRVVCRAGLRPRKTRTGAEKHGYWAPEASFHSAQRLHERRSGVESDEAANRRPDCGNEDSRFFCDFVCHINERMPIHFQANGAYQLTVARRAVA